MSAATDSQVQAIVKALRRVPGYSTGDSDTYEIHRDPAAVEAFAALDSLAARLEALEAALVDAEVDLRAILRTPVKGYWDGSGPARARQTEHGLMLALLDKLIAANDRARAALLDKEQA